MYCHQASNPPKRLLPLTRFATERNFLKQSERLVGHYNTDGTANNKPVYEGTNGGYYYYTDTYNKVPIPQNRKMFITFL